jgi:hypothetical protein
MGKFAIRLLTLATSTTTLAAVPLISSADAAIGGSKHAKRHVHKMHRAPAVQDARNKIKACFPRCTTIRTARRRAEAIDANRKVVGRHQKVSRSVALRAVVEPSSEVRRR